MSVHLPDQEQSFQVVMSVLILIMLVWKFTSEVISDKILNSLLTFAPQQAPPAGRAVHSHPIFGSEPRARNRTWNSTFLLAKKIL